MSEQLDVLDFVANSESLIKSLEQLTHDLTVHVDSKNRATQHNFKELGTISNGSSMDSENRIAFSAEKSGLPYIATKDIGYEEADVDYENGLKLPIGTKNFKVANAGSVLICMEGGSAGKKMAILNRDVYYGNKLISIQTSSDIHPRYLFSILKSTQFQNVFSLSTQGLIGGISLKNFGNIAVSIPSYEEQLLRLAARDESLNSIKAISGILLKQNLHYRQVLNTLREDFTNPNQFRENMKGNFELFISLLDRLSIDPKNRESLKLLLLDFILNPAIDGVGLLQNAPITTLGNIGDWGAGSTPIKSNPAYYGGQNTWIRSGELNDSKSVVGSEIRITDLALKDCTFKRNKKGDVLLAMYGATIGKVAILGEDAVTNQAVIGCSIKPQVLNEYLFWYLIRLRPYFTSSGVGGSQPNISKVKIEKFEIPLPSLETQGEIVVTIEKLFGNLDVLFQKLDQHESLLSEYGMGLASESNNAVKIVGNSIDELGEIVGSAR
jgi:type I restriction enzyme S subunit